MKNSLGREIPLAGLKGHRHTIVLREWVSALEELNAPMRSVLRG